VKSFDEKFSVGRGVKCAGNQDECGLRGRRHLVKPGSSRTHFVFSDLIRTRSVLRVLPSI
jgi:hypothetical protein